MTCTRWADFSQGRKQVISEITHLVLEFSIAGGRGFCLMFLKPIKAVEIESSLVNLTCIFNVTFV